MDKRRGPDKFHVGQHAILVLGEATGWARLNGEECIIVAGKQPKTGQAVDMQDRPTDFVRSEEKYGIRCGKWWLGVSEDQLRPIDDRQELSTWDEFEKLTGIDLPGSCIVAKPVRRKREVRHG